jgi:Ion channel
MSLIEAYLGLVARWRWSFLLALLIGSFVLQALLPETGLTRLAGFTLFMLIFGGAIYAGRTRAWAERGAVALLLVALLLQTLNVLGVANLEGPLAALALMIVLGALVATFAELVGTRDSTPDSLVGAIFGFFVIAAACALLFRQLEGIHPGSFRLPEGGDLDSQMLYFSLVTVTTVGYGDITPATSIAQISAALEAALGTFYIAILIGRIVGQLAPGLARSGSVPTEHTPSNADLERNPGHKAAGPP